VQINKKQIIIILFIILFNSTLNAEEIFLSLKKDKVNVRYGPSFDTPVKYIYKKINLPIKQIDKKENWRRIIDLKNNSGWIHSSQLKSSNSIITLENTTLFNKSTNFSKPLAKINKGRLLVILKCEDNWCKIKSGAFKGWVKIDKIWGTIN
jgi:SH3-like domain-containing protein